MVRKLKFHEQKLLRKTDFFTYKQDDGHRDKLVRRRYMIQKPEDYHKYNRLCGVRPPVFLLLQPPPQLPIPAFPYHFPFPTRPPGKPSSKTTSLDLTRREKNN